MAQKTRTALNSQVSTLIADNTTQNITPGDVRTCFGDLADSIGLYQIITRAALQTAISGSVLSYPCQYEISDAVSSAKALIVRSKSTSAISKMAENLTDDQYGYYDITSDTFNSILST